MGDAGRALGMELPAREPGCEKPNADPERDGGLIGLSGTKKPDCLRRAGEGDGGTLKSVSIVLSDSDGRDFLIVVEGW